MLAFAQRRKIVSALSLESDQSLKIKARVVRALIESAHADPTLPSMYGNTAVDLAGCLRDPTEIQNITSTYQQSQQ